MSAISDPRSLLDRYGLQAKKSWGQHFLIDRGIYDAIVRAAVRTSEDWIVEIGAGLGTLTTRLADAVPKGCVLAIERDRDLVIALRAEVRERANVEVREENALECDYKGIAARACRKLVVVGNLPYHIATPLLFGIIKERRLVEGAVVMLQKEMADRLLARPGTKEYGALGVMVTTYADVTRVIRAPAHAFFPRPKVESTVVSIAPLPEGKARAHLADEELYSRVVHAAFGQRRKTLRNALKQCASAHDIERALRTCDIDGLRRGETLSTLEFACLANAMRS